MGELRAVDRLALSNVRPATRGVWGDVFVAVRELGGEGRRGGGRRQTESLTAWCTYEFVSLVIGGQDTDCTSVCYRLFRCR